MVPIAIMSQQRWLFDFYFPVASQRIFKYNLIESLS